jgi:hypothetical protein
VFELIFCLIFEHKNWFQTLKGKRAHQLPGKDTVYRFLNQSTFNWRRFLILLSTHAIQKVTKLTNHDHDRPKVLIIDDLAFERNRSKSVELLSRSMTLIGL